MSTNRGWTILAALFLAVAFATPSTLAGWDPAQGEWGKNDSAYIRVMTWNVKDGLCSTNDKQEGTNNWTALAAIVASLQPDVLILQEAGDNDGNGTGSYGDSVSDLLTTIDLFLNGGNDPFNGYVPVTAYVEKYAPGYTLPYIFVSSETDGYNRDVIASRFPFVDLNGDGRSQLSDMPYVNADQYAPGGDGGIRGFQLAELDLPDGDYPGDLVVGNSHLKAGSDSSDKAQRLEAGQNIAYLIDYWFNGAGTGSPDPNGKINDSPQATQILGSDTPVIWGGDWNEDEATNGRDGPALWMVRAQSTQNDGTDRDRTDSVYDTSTDPISGSRDTSSWGKLDYLGHQDSIATQRLGFVFNSASLSSSQRPPELNNFPNPSQASSYASDHKPVIGDFEVAVLSGNNPLPDIKINGQDGPINIPDTQPVTMTIHLDPGDYQGTTMDWWILAEKLGGDTFSWIYPGSWKLGTRRAIAYPLIPIASYTIHNGTIPQGMWTIEFSLDTLDNVYQGTFKDEIYVSSYE